MPATSPDSDVEALVERLAEDMARRWRDGDRPLAEEYLARHPEFHDVPEAAAELIYEEVCLRQEYSLPVVPAEVLRRFPQWQAQLQVLLDCHQLMEGGAAAPTFPEVGDTLGDFRLRAELGRGAQGRVFLASQRALADRSVVLKFVPLVGREHLSLARLQHTHIVPLYFVQDYPERLLRALCLPYFGGATLAALLEAVRGIPLAERSGRLLLDAIRHAQTSSPVAVPVRGPACHFLAQKSYVEAACWIGACLADALHYAHERGVLHLDLKPANVLLAADGQPMLLDFHLARPPLTPGARPPDWLGGTPAYTAPEQREAWQAVRDGRPLSAALDGRADLFALGVLLREMLSGEMPNTEGAAAIDLRRLNPAVTPGLADVLRKCLAPDPQARYADAAALADDLRRHLQALPLRGVSNRSWRERWTKWRRRRPLAPAALALLLAVLAAVSAGGWHVHRQLNQAHNALREGRELMGRQQHEQAASAVERGLALADGMPFRDGLIQELHGLSREIEAVQVANELHRFVERARAASGADTLPVSEVRAMEGHCRALWEQRDRIAESLDSANVRQAQLRDDLLDLAILGTRLPMRLASAAEIPATRREALEALAEAERLCGPSCVLFRERQQHAAALGLTATAEEAARQAVGIPPRTAWEHDALGRALLENGDAEGATGYFDRALELRPDDLWANYHKGRAAHVRKLHDEALAAFTTCVALSPRSGWCHYNRGVAHLDLGRHDRALRDFDRALALEPRLADAALQRGLIHYREKRHDAAVVDLRRALQDGANAAAVHHGLALVHLARGNHAAAIEELQEVLRHDPGNKSARALLERLQRPG